jgi:hypothetical protein
MEGEDGPAGDWIVKPSGRHPHGTLALLRELAGASMAAWLGLLVPAVTLTQMPQAPSPLGSSLTDRCLHEHAGQFAFCSRYLQVSRFEQEALLGAAATEALVREGLLLLMLDALLWHYDRTPSNPNALLWRGHLTAIDHDTAFRDIGAVDEDSGLGVDFGGLSFRETSWGSHFAWPLLTTHPALAREIAEQASARMTRLEDERLDAWLARWPDALDRGRTGMPAGYKATLRQFLSTRRDRAPFLLSALLEPPPAEEP